ncbi:MAG: CHC2 zinc finger domain-containing protein [Alphaproteobacteria bacterium]
MTENRAGRIDFKAINRAAIDAGLANVLRRWVADGRVVGGEYVALNPRRNDRHRGSFRINLDSARWCDFACGAKGGDAVSYVAYVTNCSQIEAAKRLAAALGIPAKG